MTRVAIGRIALLGALLVSTAVRAAGYTGHYRYVGNPALHSDTKLRTDLTACDGIEGVQHATPSKVYRRCMLQNSGKFLHETRDNGTSGGPART